MRVEENNVIVLEYLSVASSSSIGEDQPITLKSPTSFHASNAPGEAVDMSCEEHIEKLGRDAITNFKSVFALT